MGLTSLPGTLNFPVVIFGGDGGAIFPVVVFGGGGGGLFSCRVLEYHAHMSLMHVYISERLIKLTSGCMRSAGIFSCRVLECNAHMSQICAHGHRYISDIDQLTSIRMRFVVSGSRVGVGGSGTGLLSCRLLGKNSPDCLRYALIGIGISQKLVNSPPFACASQ